MKQIGLVLIIGSSIFLACQKEVSTIVNKAPQTLASLEEFFAKNEAPVQKITVNSTNPINFNTQKGNKVNFPDNAFVTLNNTPVTGDVTIEVKEILSPGDMILNNLPTLSDGFPLESGGEFFIRVTKNNEPLKLAPGKYIRLQLPLAAGNASGMQVFNGTATGGSVNWIPNFNQGNRVLDSFAFRNMFADSLNWINIDKLINEPTITYAINPGNCPGIDSTRVFVHLTGRKTVLPFPKTTSQFSSSRIIAAPATVVGICVKNSILYASIVPVTMQDGQSATLNFSPISEEALKQKLSMLQ